MQIEISEDGFVRALLAHQITDELDRELVKCNAAIMELGGSATITLKVKVSRIPKMDKAIEIDMDVNSKYPEHERPTKTMFVNGSFGVTDQYQEQTGLAFGAAQETPRPNLKPAASNVSPLK